MTEKGTGNAQTPSPAHKKTMFNLQSLKRLVAKKTAEPVESPKKLPKKPVERVSGKKRPTVAVAPTVKRKAVKLRQIIVAKKISESIRKSKGKKIPAVGKIMEEAGYSPSYSKQAGKVVQQDAFQALLDKYLPDELIAETHAGIMKANALGHEVFPTDMEDKEIIEIVEGVWGGTIRKIKHLEQGTHAWYLVPDNRSRAKGIAEAYKVKAKYPAEKQEHTFDADITDALTRLSKMVK